MSEEKTIDATVTAIPPKQETKTQLPVPKPSLNVNESGMLVGKNLDEQYRIASAFKQSGILPKRYETTEMVLVSMQFCYELGLKPLTSMRQIAVIQGTPSMFGDLPLALAMSSGLIESFEEFFVDKSGARICLENKNIAAPVYAAVVLIKRKGQKMHESVFSIDDAAAAGLLKSSPTWNKYQKRMMKYRVRGQALKDVVPDVLNGVAIAEYDHHTTIEQFEEDEKKPTGITSAANLNNRFGEKKPDIEIPSTPMVSEPIEKTEVAEPAPQQEKVVDDDPESFENFSLK